MTIQALDRVCLSVVLAVAAFGGAGVCTLGTQREHRLRGEALIVERLMRDAEAVEEDAEKLRRSLAGLEDEFSDIPPRIPKAGLMGAFLEEIDAIMKARDVILVDLQPQSSEDKEGGCVRIPLQMTCVGSFADLHRSLHALESLPRLVRMDTLTMARLAVGEQCRAQITISIFEKDVSP